MNSVSEAVAAVVLDQISVRVADPADKPEILCVESLKIASSNDVVLTGPSGSGKTTLLNVIAGLLPVTSGVVDVLGNRLSEMGESDRDTFRAQRIGMVFQTFNLLPGLTAVENVMLGAMISGMPVAFEQAADLLKEVGLEHRINSFPGTLSIGERQRVAVARAVVHSPALILADEPTGSLDAQRASDVMDILFKEAERCKSALIVVTHDTDMASRFSRRIDLRDLNLAGRKDS